MKKKKIITLACSIMFCIGLHGQSFNHSDMLEMKKTPEVLPLLSSAIHYVVLYENDADSLTKAITYIDKMIDINPNISFVHKWKGGILFCIGKQEESLALFSSLCEKDDCTYDTMFLTGMVYEKTGDIKRAHDYYARALDKNSKVLQADSCSLKDFRLHLAIKYFIDGKVLTIDDVKSLLPVNLRNTSDDILKKDISELYKVFDRDVYIKDMWNINLIKD